MDKLLLYLSFLFHQIFRYLLLPLQEVVAVVAVKGYLEVLAVLAIPRETMALLAPISEGRGVRGAVLFPI